MNRKIFFEYLKSKVKNKNVKIPTKEDLTENNKFFKEIQNMLYETIDNEKDEN